MASSVILPAEVLASLAPALEAVREEVREGVRSVMIPRIVRAAQVAVRVNGVNYARGAAAIVGAVTDPSALRVNQLLAARDEDVQRETRARLGAESVTIPAGWLGLPSASDDEDDEDDEDEDEDECDHSSGTSCCGYCSDCNTHHDEDEYYLSETCHNCSYCPNCDHDCSSY